LSLPPNSEVYYLLQKLENFMASSDITTVLNFVTIDLLFHMLKVRCIQRENTGLTRLIFLYLSNESQLKIRILKFNSFPTYLKVGHEINPETVE
jgi:hypothetical protein